MFFNDVAYQFFDKLKFLLKGAGMVTPSKSPSPTKTFATPTTLLQTTFTRTPMCCCNKYISLLFPITDCNSRYGQQYSGNAQSGSVRSPNYPSNYPNNVVCTWTIKVARGYRISCSFTAFSTGNIHVINK